MPVSSDIGSLDDLKRLLKERNIEDLTDSLVREQFAVAHGIFSDIYQGRYRKNEAVAAIKSIRFNVNEDGPSTYRVFAREILIWSGLDDKNILPLKGFFAETSPRLLLALVSDWMHSGNASDYVQKNPKNVDRLILAKGIASGLEYLHSKKVVHADLKASNVLITPEGEAVIADFGISRWLVDGVVENLNSLRGSTRWMAPELLERGEGGSPSVHDYLSDVWAFGMTTLELLTGLPPYDYVRSEAQVVVYVLRGVLPNKPSNLEHWKSEEDELWNVCEMCWNFDAGSRPTSLTILQHLKVLLAKRTPESTPVTAPAPSAPTVLGVDRSTENFKALDKLLIESANRGLDLTEIVRKDSETPLTLGGYASIYSSTFPNGERVAIKVSFFWLNKQDKLAKSSVREIRIWGMLRHANLLPFLGFVRDPSHPLPLMVSPWMDNGSLTEFMKNRPDLINNLKMARGIANGVQYLHSNEVIHGDLKAANVLVSRDIIPLVADFGISRRLDGTTLEGIISLTQVGGTTRYQSPELLNPPAGFDVAHTKASDVWAYGMIILELLTRDVPYPEVKLERHLIVPMINNPIPSDPSGMENWKEDDKGLWKLCKKFFWLRNPALRPDMTQVLYELDNFQVIRAGTSRSGT